MTRITGVVRLAPKKGGGGGGKGHFGDALCLTTTHLLFLGTLLKDNKHPLFYAPPLIKILDLHCWLCVQG